MHESVASGLERTNLGYAYFTSCPYPHEGKPLAIPRSTQNEAPGYPDRGLQIEEIESAQLAEVTLVATASADDCVIDGDSFFVRGCIDIKVHGHSDPFIWGVWVSLSKAASTNGSSPSVTAAMAIDLRSQSGLALSS